MSELHDDELISAYLDNELSSEDRARVERLLESQPEARQMLEELQALRESLRALPKQSFGHSIADEVLRRAEREMLTPRAAASSRSTDVTPIAPPYPPLLSWARWQRPLIWSSLAVAAALVLMVFSRDDFRADKVAVNAPADGQLRGGGQGEWKAAGGALGEDAPVELFANDGRGLNEEGRPQLATSASDAAPAGATGLSNKPNTADGDFSTEGVRPSVSNLNVGFTSGENLGRLQQLSEYLVSEEQEKSQPPSQELLVIRCEVSPETAKSEKFRQLLAKQRIAWDESLPTDNKSSGESAKRQDSSTAGKDQDVAAVETATRPQPVTRESGSEGAQKQAKLGETRQSLAFGLDQSQITTLIPDNAEAVFVCAEPRQLNATLEALAGDKQQYRNAVCERIQPATSDIPGASKERYADTLDAESNQRDNVPQRQAGTRGQGGKSDSAADPPSDRQAESSRRESAAHGDIDVKKKDEQRKPVESRAFRMRSGPVSGETTDEAKSHALGANVSAGTSAAPADGRPAKPMQPTSQDKLRQEAQQESRDLSRPAEQHFYWYMQQAPADASQARALFIFRIVEPPTTPQSSTDATNGAKGK